MCNVSLNAALASHRALLSHHLTSMAFCCSLELTKSVWVLPFSWHVPIHGQAVLDKLNKDAGANQIPVNGA